MRGTVSFPGISQVESATYTLSHGVSPGVAQLEIVPQAAPFSIGGDLVFGYSGKTVRVRDCKIDSGSYQRDQSGLVWRLAVLDRRWRWRYGEVSGLYNARHDNGTLVDQPTAQTSIVYDTVKKPQDLAKLLLDAMGEQYIHVGDLPNDTHPLVEWDATNPARALADLAESLGCRVVLELDGRVSLRKAGQGQHLPPGFMELSGAVDPPERPDKITVVCGKNRYQADFQLEAVGREADGTVKPIDDLSYKPTNGWDTVDLKHFNQVSDKKDRERAKQYVYRWYQIKFPMKLVGIDENGNETAHDVDGPGLVLPLASEQIDEVTEDGVKRSKPAQVWGVWSDGTEGGYANRMTAPLKTFDDFTTDAAKRALYEKSFQVHGKLGIVEFGDAVFQWEETTVAGTKSYKAKPAELVLRASCGLRREDTREWRRYRKTWDFGNQFGTKALIVRRDELILNSKPQYDPAGYTAPPTGAHTNRSTVDAEADHYIAAADAQFQLAEPQTAAYADLLALSPDGAIHQVAWSVGPGGTTTTICRNNELLVEDVGYKVKRFYDRCRELIEKAGLGQPGTSTARRNADRGGDLR